MIGVADEHHVDRLWSELWIIRWNLACVEIGDSLLLRFAIDVVHHRGLNIKPKRLSSRSNRSGKASGKVPRAGANIGDNIARRILKKKLPDQSGAVGRMRISHLGNSG